MPKRLLADDHPVLFEGLHTTAALPACARRGKHTLVRVHNIEHNYYRTLARGPGNAVSKLFFFLESVKLKRYERVLRQCDHILAISETEQHHFQSLYGKTTWLPAFTDLQPTLPAPGTGDYVLIHGNLSVAENREAVFHVVERLWQPRPFPLIIAGKNPPTSLRRQLEGREQIRLIANPGPLEMEELLRNAQVHLLYTRTSNGVKIKLLHALNQGRHCLVNPAMVEGTGLASLCHVARTEEEFREKLPQLLARPFSEEEAAKRKRVLETYDPGTLAKKVVELLS